MLGERAEGIEARRPALMAAARVALTPVLKLPPISRRAREVRPHSAPLLTGPAGMLSTVKPYGQRT